LEPPEAKLSGPAPGPPCARPKEGPIPLPIPGPSRWRFPDPATAGEDGLVGIGALEGVTVSRSLRARLRRSGWETTVDRAFAAVLAGCADRRGDPRGSGGLKPGPPVDQGEGGTWITPPMRVAYQRLHDLGHAHSLEVWAGDKLVGGLYGIGVGGVFTGESMFHLASDASKVALVDLTARLTEAGGCLIDVQMVTPHLASLGARDLPRAEFLDLLARARDEPVRLPGDRLPVARLG